MSKVTATPKAHGHFCGWVDSRTLEVPRIRPFDRSEVHAWVNFKPEAARYAFLPGFGQGLFRDPPLCVDPFDDKESLGLGMSSDDIERARFGCILLLNTVRDGVDGHILFESRSPTIAWRALGKEFSPKTSRSNMDDLSESKNQKYSKD